MIQSFNSFKGWLSHLSFRTGIILLICCGTFYIVSFAQMTLPISIVAKGVLWTIFFGLAKAAQYSALLIFGKEGVSRIKNVLKGSVKPFNLLKMFSGFSLKSSFKNLGYAKNTAVPLIVITTIQAITILLFVIAEKSVASLNPGFPLYFLLCSIIVIFILAIPPFIIKSTTTDNKKPSIPFSYAAHPELLLGRVEIKLDNATAKSTLRNKCVLVTGCAGSIGSELVRQLAQLSPANLILIDQAETPLHRIRLMMDNEFSSIPVETIVADIVNKDRMEAIFGKWLPDFVFHAAAYKHVPMMEDNPRESIENNVEGTRVIADLAVRYGVEKFIMISTDKAVFPTNVMGCSKRICEMYVQSVDSAIKAGRLSGRTKFVTTRFGNVLASAGSVVELFSNQIANGGPVTVTHKDVTRYFMLKSEACRLVLEAASMGEGGEIFAFDMGKPVNIDSLAKKMIQLSGRTDISIVYTGLRAGEKLTEIVLTPDETTQPTRHPLIKRAKVRAHDFLKVKSQIDRLLELSKHAAPDEIVAAMRRIVPEYQSNNPAYSSCL